MVRKARRIVNDSITISNHVLAQHFELPKLLLLGGSGGMLPLTIFDNNKENGAIWRNLSQDTNPNTLSKKLI